MTVLGTDSRAEFNCTGGTSYPLGAGFLFIASADLVVVRVDADGVPTTLTEGSDYSVSGGDGLTGTVTTVATYSDGKLVVYRETENKQTYDAERGDGFNVNTFERALDRMVMSLQEMARSIGRTLSLSDSDTTTADLTIPAPEANKVFGWNAAGTALENKEVDLVQVSALATAASGSADAAAAAQTGAETAQGLAETAQTAAEAAQTAAEAAEAGAVAAVTAALGRGALVTLTSNQSIATVTTTAVNFSTAASREEYDTDSIHDGGTNPTRLTVPSGVSVIKLHGHASFQSNATGQREVLFYKNGSLFDAGNPFTLINATAGGSGTDISISSPMLVVSPGDYFELYVWQNSGSSLLLSGAGGSKSYIAMEIVK